MPGLGMMQTWTPRVLFGATAIKGFWLDVSDMSTMFQDAAGTTACAINSPVGLIKDKSGNANDFSQSTSENRPTLKQDSSNRLYLDFGGTHWLSANLSTTDLGGNISKTIYAAFSYATTSARNSIFLIGDQNPSPGPANGSVFGISGSAGALKNSVYQWGGPPSYDTQGASIVADKQIYAGVKNVNDLSLYKNGSLDSSISGATANVTVSLTRIGKLTAALPSGATDFAGSIYGMVLIATATRYPQLEKWMSDRMALVY